MLAVLLSLALMLPARAAPSGDVHWYGSTGSDRRAMGIGAGLAWPGGRVRGEVSGDLGGVFPEGFEVHVRGAVRLLLTDPEAPWVLSMRAGPGVRFSEGARGYGFAGLGLDGFRSGNLRLRLGADALVDPVASPSFRATLALVLQPPGVPKPPPRPPVGADGVGERPPAAGTTAPVGPDEAPQEALVWIPHPICQWVPLAEAEAWTERLEPETELQVRAPGFLPSSVPAGDLRDVALSPAPSRGGLVVVAEPGDRVQVGDRSWFAPDDGVVAVNVPVGPVQVLVQGYGRTRTLEAATADGYATWVRAPDPTTRILFAAGSSKLDDRALATIRQLVEDAAEGVFEVTGSHSPEGGLEQNERLAADRAFAVATALVAEGLPQERVRVLPAVPPDPALSIAEQRSVLVEPLPPRDSP